MLIFTIDSINNMAQQEEVQFFFREIRIGNSFHDHIRIPSVKKDQSLLRVSHQQEGVLLESIDEYAFYLAGKKIIGTKVWKVGQTLEVGDYSITLTQIDFSQSHSAINLEQGYDFFYQNHQEYDSILTALERELILSDE